MTQNCRGSLLLSNHDQDLNLKGSQVSNTSSAIALGYCGNSPADDPTHANALDSVGSITYIEATR